MSCQGIVIVVVGQYVIGEHYYGLRRAVPVLVGAGAAPRTGGEWSAGAG